MGVGLGWIIVDRLKKPAETEGSTAHDWTFIGLLSTVVVTGFFVEVLRFADVAAVAYPLYFIHLVFVFGVLMYLPYSRFAHLVYRTVALVYAKHTGRELAGQSTAEQPADDHAGKPAPAAAQGASAA
jgi:quinone-modifying oxidoreductase subunit QmoC